MLYNGDRWSIILRATGFEIWPWALIRLSHSSNCIFAIITGKMRAGKPLNMELGGAAGILHLCGSSMRLGRSVVPSIDLQLHLGTSLSTETTPVFFIELWKERNDDAKNDSRKNSES